MYEQLARLFRSVDSDSTPRISRRALLMSIPLLMACGRNIRPYQIIQPEKFGQSVLTLPYGEEQFQTGSFFVDANPSTMTITKPLFGQIIVPPELRAQLTVALNPQSVILDAAVGLNTKTPRSYKIGGASAEVVDQSRKNSFGFTWKDWNIFSIVVNDLEPFYVQNLRSSKKSFNPGP